ncbi:hypothetical protein ACWGTO_08430 [Mesorhizobium sp. PL10]
MIGTKTLPSLAAEPLQNDSDMLFGNSLPIQRLCLMEGTPLSNPSSHSETLRAVSDLVHRARIVIRDSGHAVAMFEIDTLLQVAQTEVARSLERNDR